MAILLLEEFRKFTEWEVNAYPNPSLGTGIVARNPRWVQKVWCAQPRTEDGGYLAELYVDDPFSPIVTVQLYKDNQLLRDSYCVNNLICWFAMQYPNTPPEFSAGSNFRLITSAPVVL
jgi:hypothetical protein